MASSNQLLLHMAEEEGVIELRHLEKEFENIMKGGTGQEIGELLNLFTSGVETSLLEREREREGGREGELGYIYMYCVKVHVRTLCVMCE